MDGRLSQAVRRLLAPEHKAVAVIRCTLTRGRKSLPRVCILVEHGGEHCLLICRELNQDQANAVISSNCIASSGSTPAGNVLIGNVTANATSGILCTDFRLPVSTDFKFDVETMGIDQTNLGLDQNVLSATITFRKKRLIFETHYSDASAQFIRELGRAVEHSNYRNTPHSDYLWVEVYKSNSKFFLDVNHDDEDDIFGGYSSSVVEDSSSCGMGESRAATRECMAKSLMQEREDEFTVLNDFRIVTATWNVNGQSPGSLSLEDWLGASSLEPPDLYAIGFQELDLSKEAFLFADSPREKEWLAVIRTSLHPRASYQEVKTIRLIGMMLSVFVRDDHIDDVSGVDCNSVGTGILGVMGNKGGVAIRFDLHSTSLCFVNCHLAAHAEERERRNQDFNDIRNRIIFSSLRPPKAVGDHDQIYWIGDMNYRLQDTTREIVAKACAAEDYKLLWERDQLRDQQRQGHIFVGFQEGALSFKPTYKYDVGTNRWDSSEKARVPAYCDRVLWRGCNIQQTCYRSHDSFVLSDHKPVSANFVAGVRVVDYAKRKEVCQEVMKQLDKEENDFLPQVAVDQHYLHFGRMHFYERAHKTLRITNTGPVIVKFLFKERERSAVTLANDSCAAKGYSLYDSAAYEERHKRYARPWLKADPYSGTLRRGESVSCCIQL